MDEETYNNYLRFIKTFAIYRSEQLYKAKNSEDFIEQNNLTDIKKFSAVEIGNLYGKYINYVDVDDLTGNDEKDYDDLLWDFDIIKLIKKLYLGSMKNYASLATPVPEVEYAEKLYNQLTGNKQYHIKFQWDVFKRIFLENRGCAKYDINKHLCNITNVKKYVRYMAKHKSKD